MLPSDSDQAQVEAYRDFLVSLLTELMSVNELATEWFKVGRKKLGCLFSVVNCFKPNCWAGG